MSADSQKQGSSSPSGGQKIDDHSFWAGSPSKGSVFPMGAKTKDHSSASSAGNLATYEDTTEKVKAQQDRGTSKIKSHPRRELERH